MQLEEIGELCFTSQRFLKSSQKLTEKYPDTVFTNLIKDSLEGIIGIANDPGNTLAKSENYLTQYSEENDVTFEGGNPFNLALFSEQLDIIVIFIIIQECKDFGYDSLLPADIDKQIVYAFDLFDTTRNRSLNRVRN